MNESWMQMAISLNSCFNWRLISYFSFISNFEVDRIEWIIGYHFGFGYVWKNKKTPEKMIKYWLTKECNGFPFISFTAAAFFDLQHTIYHRKVYLYCIQFILRLNERNAHILFTFFFICQPLELIVPSIRWKISSRWEMSIFSKHLRIFVLYSLSSISLSRQNAYFINAEYQIFLFALCEFVGITNQHVQWKKWANFYLKGLIFTQVCMRMNYWYKSQIMN